MIARTSSTIILWILTILAIIFGGAYAWTIIIALLSAGAIYEACAIMRKMGYKPLYKTLQALNILLFIFSTLHNGSYIFASIYTISIAFALLLTILKKPFDDYFSKTLLPTILTFLAIPSCLQWLAVMGFSYDGTNNKWEGVILSAMVLASAKFSDVGAYLFGKTLGRHKLAPQISPKKTIEGAIGGLIVSTAVALAIYYGFNHILSKNIAPLLVATLGFVMGATAICSDLIESVFKRRANVKDSGAIIPGIGGALDLADSLLLSAPIGAFILFLYYNL